MASPFCYKIKSTAVIKIRELTGVRFMQEWDVMGLGKHVGRDQIPRCAQPVLLGHSPICAGIPHVCFTLHCRLPSLFQN